MTSQLIQINAQPLSPTLGLPLSLSLSTALELQGDSPQLQAQKGQLLRLLCAADSRPPANLSWVLGDRVLSWSNLEGPGGLELVLSRVWPGDAGRYCCRAENKLGLQSRTLSLSVRCEYDPAWLPGVG